jgi:hypothetical protein
MNEVKIPKEIILSEMYEEVLTSINKALKQANFSGEVKDIEWTAEGLTLKLSSPT